MVGRADELRIIARLDARTDTSAGVALVGSAGVGKTRLAREALARTGAPARWIGATASSRALPLGALAGFLGLVEDRDPTRLVHRAADALVAGTGSRAVIGVDDAHLLDELSAQVLHRLAVRRAATLVLTVRTGEALPDPVRQLCRAGKLASLEIHPLSEPDTASLLEQVLGGPVDPAAARRLWTITQGNLLYLRQLVDSEREAGRLVEAGGLWRWEGQPTLSSGLVELVESRIGQLPGPVGRVLDLLALAEPLPEPVLVELGGPSAVDAAAARGLVSLSGPAPTERGSGDNQARLAHPLYGEVRRARCGTLRARRLRGELASALARSLDQATHDEYLRAAVLALDSDREPDPDMLAEAARIGVRRLEYGLAQRLAEAAIRAGAGIEARLTLGYANSWSGQAAEAEAQFGAIDTIGCSDGQRVRLAVARAGNLFFSLRSASAGEAVLSRAASSVGPPEAWDLVAMSAVFDACRARPARAAEVAGAVLSAAEASPTARAFAAWAAAIAGGCLGRVDALRDVVSAPDRANASFHTGPIWVRADLMYQRALRLAGRLDEAETVGRPYLEAMRDGFGGLYQFGCYMGGELARERGQLETATRLLDSFVLLTRLGYSHSWPVARARARAMVGDVAGAREALAEADAAHHDGLAYLEPDLRLARAWLSAAEGVTSEAITLARQAAELAGSRGQAAVEVVARHTAVRFGDRDQADRLAALSAQVDGPRAPAAAAHAAALAAEDAEALLAAARQLESFGALALAADAAAQAAAVASRAGHRGSARAATEQAGRLAAKCPALRTPALTVLSIPLPLTDREREIITLVTAGQTTRQIADRLGVSTRTVEGHRYRAGAKLGTGDRAELAALLRLPGAGPAAGAAP